MLEGVGVWAYWLKHWPLSNQKISKEIATKSSPSMGWVGNFGVTGNSTSAGSIPWCKIFPTVSCPQWMAKNIFFGQAPRRIFAAQFRFFSRVLRRHAPEDIVFMFFCCKRAVSLGGIEIPEVKTLSQNNLTRYNGSTMLNDDTSHVLTGACLGGWATVATWRPYFSTVTWLIFVWTGEVSQKSRFFFQVRHGNGLCFEVGVLWAAWHRLFQFGWQARRTVIR